VDGRAEAAPVEVVPQILALSPDGQHVAHGVKKDKKYPFVADGQCGAEYEFIEGGKFSSDGKHFAYMAKKAGKHLLVIDGHEVTEYDKIENAWFSNDFKHVAIQAFSHGRSSLVVDGQPAGEGYDYISGLTVSPDGTRVAYAAKRGKNWTVRGIAFGNSLNQG
jgi:hypothetical protein